LNNFSAEWVDFNDEGDVAFRVLYEYFNDSISVKKIIGEDQTGFSTIRYEVLNYYKYSEFLKDSLLNIYELRSKNIKPKEYDGMITFYTQDNESPTKRFYFKNGFNTFQEEYFKNLIFEKLISIDTFTFLNSIKKNVPISNNDMFPIIGILKVPYNGVKRTRNGNAEIYNGYVNFDDNKKFNYKSFYRIPGTYEIESSQGEGLFLNGYISTLDYNTFIIKIPVYTLQKNISGEIEINYNRLDNKLGIIILNTGIQLEYSGVIEGVNLSKILSLIRKYFPEINFEILKRNEKIKYLQYFKEKQKIEFNKSVIGKYIKAGRLDIAQYDFPELMNFQDAKNISNQIGDDWRLPTIGDFRYIDSLVNNNKDLYNIYNLKNTNYLTSSYQRYFHSSSGWLEDPSKVLVYNFNRKDGLKEIINYGNLANVRVVRGLSSEIIATIGSIKNINTLLVSESDYFRGIRFQEVSNILEEFGTKDGWRLPTNNELDLLFEKKSEYNLNLDRYKGLYLTKEIFRDKSNSTRNIDYKLRVVRDMTKKEILEYDVLMAFQKKQFDAKVNSLNVLDLFSGGIVSNISEINNTILIISNLKKITNYGVVSDFNKLENGLTKEGWRLPNYEEMKIFKRLYDNFPEFRLKFTGDTKKTHYYFYYTTKQGLERFEVGNGYFTSPENDKENANFIHFFGVKDFVK
jgi:hypothetical protein